MKHQCRDADARQDVAHVDAFHNLDQRPHHPGAGRGPLIHTGSSALEAARSAWCEEVDRPARSPVGNHVVEAIPAGLPALPLLGIGVLQPPREGAVEDQRGDPLGRARGQQRTGRPALGKAHHNCPLAAGGVEHEADVLHALLQRGYVGDRVRAARSGLVVGDYTGDRSQPAEKARVPRIRPLEVEVRDEAGRVKQVDRARAPDLISDADSIRTSHVAGVRLLHAG
jgi:hypothetical protein